MLSNHEVDELIVGAGRVLREPTPIVNPAHRTEVVGYVSQATLDDVDDAVTAAATSFPAWSGTSVVERAARLSAAADSLEARRSEFAHLLVRENGKTQRECEGELGSAVQILRYYASLAGRFAAEVVEEDERGRIVTRRCPMGVTAVIVPWNFPVTLGFLMCAPALLAGNTVVVKLPEHCPLTLLRSLALVGSHLPTGVINVLAGDGPQVGSGLVRHAAVRKVLFTGSTATGRAVMSDASATLKSVSLELGGNDPALVLESAEPSDSLAFELLRGALTAAGQLCYGIKRVYVHRRHHDELVARLRDVAAKRVLVGSGLEPEVTMGPLNNEPQLERVRKLVGAAEGDGAISTVLGRPARSFVEDRGNFLMPVLLTELDPRADVVREEQFGPVLPVLPFDDEDEAIAAANETEYGLAASVWTDDPERASQVARRLEAGSVFVNVHRLGASDVSMPFGGFKQSGIGRGHGFVSLEECSELQVIAERRHLP